MRIWVSVEHSVREATVPATDIQKAERSTPLELLIQPRPKDVPLNVIYILLIKVLELMIA